MIYELKRTYDTMVYLCKYVVRSMDGNVGKFSDEIPFLLLTDGERVTHYEEGDAGIAEDAKRAHRKIYKGDTFELPL